MKHDLIRMSLLEPGQGEQAKAICADLQDMLAHGTAKEIAQKEKSLDAFHAKSPVVVAYPVWKRLVELLQKSQPTRSAAIAGFLVPPDAIESCMKEVSRLADDPDLKPVVTIFQRATSECKWLLQTVPREDV